MESSLSSEAADLARTIVVREPAAAVVAALRSAGLLDEELPAGVRVEVVRELGRAHLPLAVEVAGADDLLLAAALTGAAEALLDCGLAYARERVVFGKPLASFPLQRHFFAEVAAQTGASAALVRRAAELADPVDLAAALPWASDTAWAAAEQALQIHGGYGYSDEYPVSRMWREVAAVRSEVVPTRR